MFIKSISYKKNSLVFVFTKNKNIDFTSFSVRMFEKLNLKPYFNNDENNNFLTVPIKDVTIAINITKKILYAYTKKSI